MKQVCPHCQSSSIYEMTDSVSSTSIDALCSPTVLVGLGVSLCKSFNVHPAIGVVTGTILASIAEATKPSHALPLRIEKPYHCSNCSHVFSTIN